MLFPSLSEVNHTWSLIARATIAGELGYAAKVATDDGTQNSRLICIYTPDFSDRKDVKRVLERLLELGLCSRNGAMAEGGGRFIIRRMLGRIWRLVVGMSLG